MQKICRCQRRHGNRRIGRRTKKLLVRIKVCAWESWFEAANPHWQGARCRRRRLWLRRVITGRNPKLCVWPENSSRSRFNETGSELGRVYLWALPIGRLRFISTMGSHGMAPG